MLIELFCIGMPGVRTDGLSVYGHVITKFSRMGRLLHFLTHGAPLARFAGESSAIRFGKTGNQKRATCLATFLLNELKSNVGRFTTHVQTC